MMTASINQASLRYRPLEHRTEPPIVLQMEAIPGGNAKMKPTVFLPSALLRTPESRRSE